MECNWEEILRIILNLGFVKTWRLWSWFCKRRHFVARHRQFRIAQTWSFIGTSEQREKNPGTRRNKRLMWNQAGWMVFHTSWELIKFGMKPFWIGEKLAGTLLENMVQTFLNINWIHFIYYTIYIQQNVTVLIKKM